MRVFVDDCLCLGDDIVTFRKRRGIRDLFKRKRRTWRKDSYSPAHALRLNSESITVIFDGFDAHITGLLNATDVSVREIFAFE